MKNKLSVIENAIHFCVWSSACFYSLYILFVAQTDVLEGSSNIKYTLRDLKPGWWFLRQLKDESDVEWSTCKYFVQLSWFYMLFQVLISEFIRRTNASILKYWYIISSTIFIMNYMGFKQLLIIISQPIIFWIIIFCGGKRISIWLTSIILLVGYNSLKYKYYLWHFLDSEKDEEVFLMLYAIAWIELKCISYCLDYIDKKEKLENSQNKDNFLYNSVSENIINMFSYVMYLPVLFLGPIILYEEFEKSFHVKNDNISLRIKRFMWDMTVYVIYSILLEIAFHYIYFFAMQSNIKVVYMLPSSALCGGGLWMGLEFHIKYVISYGTNTSYARLDNIDPPPTPRCIARIHVYSQMWRYFDVGLYRFLFMYIYTPVYNTLKYYKTMSKTSYKLISSLITFLFIFMWHGTSWNIFVWSVLNYIGFLLEYIGKLIGQCEKYKWFKDKVLRTEAMEVRFNAFLCAPLLGLSAISNFYLFAGSDVGDMYFGLLNSPSICNCAVVYLSLYASCHVAIALQDLPSRSDKKNY